MKIFIFSTFLKILTHYKAPNKIIFIVLIYGQPKETHKTYVISAIFKKNLSQKIFDSNRRISPRLGPGR